MTEGKRSYVLLLLIFQIKRELEEKAKIMCIEVHRESWFQRKIYTGINTGVLEVIKKPKSLSYLKSRLIRQIRKETILISSVKSGRRQ